MRWKNNVYGEYDRLESIRKREKEALEDQLKDSNNRLDKEIERERARWEEKMEETARKQANEIKRIKEEGDIRKQQWMDEYQ